MNFTVVQKGKSEMTNAERNRMQAEIKELQKTVSVSRISWTTALLLAPAAFNHFDLSESPSTT